MDLKTPNILLNATKDQAKISDVGLAKFTSDAGTIATGGKTPLLCRTTYKRHRSRA